MHVGECKQKHLQKHFTFIKVVTMTQPFNRICGCKSINIFGFIRRHKSLNSSAWLERREKDKFVELAKTQNYRCRSAFKLLEIDEKYKILQPGMTVVDLGAAPGSWTQVLVNKTNSSGKDNKKPKGFVVALDRLPIYPIDGATILSQLDFTLKSSHEKLQEIIGDRSVNMVVSDMAPNATGVKDLDQDGIFNLAFSALRFAVLTSTPKACFLVKIWDGRSRTLLETEAKRFYNQINYIRPKATQTESTELFLLARHFKGLKRS